MTVVTAMLMLILPVPLLLTGLVGSIGAACPPRVMKQWTRGAVWFALVASVVVAGTSVLRGSHQGAILATHRWLSASVDVNTVTVLMLLLVSMVGMIVIRYSATYLQGDPHETRFHRWLGLTLGSLLVLIVAGNLWEFLVFWVVTSVFVTKLLQFYRERPVAVRAARKYSLFQRIADVSLLAAIILLVHTLHTAQFSQLATALRITHGSWWLWLASGLLVLSAVLKSAQFPFHGWLIQVMEAPTPVSALLHAGIIYMGAFLLLRMVPLLSHALWSGEVLIIIGLVSITTASLMMMTRTNIKGSLAYSTSGQMGFMLLEYGMGLYGLVILHIMAHAVYKAHAFLSSGSVVEQFRTPVFPIPPEKPTLAKILLSLVIAVPIVIATAWAVNLPFMRQAPVIVMGIILTVASAHLLLQALNRQPLRLPGLLGLMVALSVGVSLAYFGLDVLMTRMTGSLWPIKPATGGIVDDGLLALTGVVVVGLLFLQQMLPRLKHHPWWQALYVHLYNDLYVDMIFTRIMRTMRLTRAPHPSPTTGDKRVRKATS